ncbi:unnamed protein product, partial [Ixodes persulcatus]
HLQCSWLCCTKKRFGIKVCSCKALCLLQRSEVPPILPAAAAKEWDMGGLLYSSEQLFKLILTLENKLAQVFSTCQLHAGLMVDVASSLVGLPKIGCSEHAEVLTKDMTNFYCVTRFNFLLKGKKRLIEKKCKNG